MKKDTVLNIQKYLCAEYGSCAVNMSIVSHMAQKVKASESVEMELHDFPYSGCSATATSPDMMNCSGVIICMNW